MSPERGQTLPDFVVAIAIFLLAIAFLVGFIPQITAPYADQEHPIVSDRVASDLAKDLVADDQGISTLNETCTVAFFTDESAAECPFSDNSMDALSVGDRYAVNVSIVRGDGDDAATLCAQSGEINQCTEEADEPLTIGPEPPRDRGSVSVSHRTVHIDGFDMRINVKVWEP